MLFQPTNTAGMTEDEIIQATVKQASEMHQSQTGPVADRQVTLHTGVRRLSSFMKFYRATRMANISCIYMHGSFFSLYGSKPTRTSSPLPKNKCNAPDSGRGRGRGRPLDPSRPPPPGYICHSCGQPGMTALESDFQVCWLIMFACFACRFSLRI